MMSKTNLNVPSLALQALAVVLLAAPVAGVAATYQPDVAAYTIGEIQTTLKEVRVLKTAEEMPAGLRAMLKEAREKQAAANLNPSLSPMDLDLTSIINLGKQIWQIVQAGRPVVNIKTDSASALPLGTKQWTELENWSDPVSHTYTVAIKNLYGYETVSFDYRVLSITGGSSKGVGHYIAYATIEPSNINVSWGFSLAATTKIPMVYNHGTHRDPVGAMQMDMNYVVTSVLSHIESTDSFSLKGTGQLTQLQ